MFLVKHIILNSVLQSRLQLRICDDSCLPKLIKLSENGSDNPDFVPIIDYLHIGIRDARNFFSSLETKIISLRVRDLFEWARVGLFVGTGLNNPTQEMNQSDLAESMRNNQYLQESLQFFMAHFDIK